MTRFDVSPAAAADLENIAAFLDDHAPHATDTVLDTLHNAMRHLAKKPNLGHPRENLADEPLRFYAVWSYLVIFRVTKRVEMVRVLHATPDVARKFRDSRNQMKSR